MLPTAIVPFLFAMATAYVLTRIKRVKLLSLLGLASLTGGMIAMYTLNENSGLAKAFGFQIIYALGLGILFPTRTMMIQAAQANDDDVPMASSVASILLNIGQCFGQAIGSAIFENWWNRLVDAAASNGSLPPHDVIPGNVVEQSFERIRTLPAAIRDQYRHIGASSVSMIWLVLACFCAATFLLCVFVKDVSFDRDTETKLSFDDEETRDEKPLLTRRKSLTLEEGTYHSPDGAYDAPPEYPSRSSSPSEEDAPDDSHLESIPFSLPAQSPEHPGLDS
jgi:hypothetical protein